MLPFLRKVPLLQDKTDLIDFTFSRFNVHSFADLGGVWRVEGGYTFHALDRHKIERGFLVDTHPTEIVKKRAAKYPNLKLITGNFGDERTSREVGKVDAVLFFDVLLHQVLPDWDQVLEMYDARCLIIYNQMWTGDTTVRLFDLGEDEYFRNVPHDRSEEPYKSLFSKLDEPHPDHGGRRWRDIHHAWQWGVTGRDMQNKVESLGYRIQYLQNYGEFGGLPSFHNYGFVFTR